MKLAPVLAVLLLIPSFASACGPNEAREEARRILTRKYGAHNKIYVGPPQFEEDQYGKHQKVAFAIVSTDPGLTELGEIGAIRVYENNNCRGDLEAVSSTQLN